MACRVTDLVHMRRRADPALWRLKALTTFHDLGVIPEIAAALESEGIVEPFPIQSLAVPIGLSGHDIIGQARTGTGKTLAFGIPLLQRIEHGGKKPLALVIVPTRELAVQVTDDLNVAGGKLGTRVLSVYGGRAYEPQIDALREGVEAVVGTPGRLLDLVKQKHLDLSQVSVLVLDEADRMLDLGFLPDIERLVDRVPARRQTMLFSATMPGEIVALSRKYLTRPTNVRAESHEESEATPQVVQHVFQAHQMDKPELLSRVLQARGRGLTMVFCQTKRACDRVADDLVKRGFAAAAVHGDLGQGQRERALRAFRSGKIDVLVATDVAARGLDVDDVTHVVNYECPDAADTYVHRIGRTGRAGKEGIAVTLVDWADLQRWKLINSALGLEIAEPAETYSTSDHLYEALDIPTEVTGTLPKAQRDRAGLEAEEVEDIGETGRTRSPRRTESRTERTRKPRTRTRTRTRTRGGRPIDADAAPEAAEAVAEVVGETVAEEQAVPEPQADTVDAGVENAEPARPSRSRRRTRRGVETSTDTITDTADTAVDDAPAETPAAPAPVQAPIASTPAGVPVVQFMAPPADPEAEAAHLAEAAQSKPRRRRRSRTGGARRPV
ncbi:DEAD/DEAH box helicase [Actinoallomurus sp. NBC_01490]|uniref:DEAD/DEAH box helicase n=1 Tax=Actinoallomurus sp. NBC_01490 TaxID=2903557 RepID=UPI002E30EDDA|nr:DEAD/DEAH box helicase [Actinoallomurus sp. NBC_01490]